ncbi:MAG: hypothetical protein R2879_05490 [Saprospiraceae bacterium]
MSQFSWTVIGQNGKKYQIGLYHGNKTGHVMVHCNMKVILIDFSVLESKQYSFFLDEELCELNLERQGDSFRYGLNLNKDADTPLNRKRKLLDKRNLIQSGLFLLGTIAVIGTIIFAIHFFRNHGTELAKNELLAKEGLETSARLVHEDEKTVWSYIYIADGKAYTRNLTEENLRDFFPYPLPLANSDEFKLKYARSNPNVHEILWAQPDEKSIKRFKALAYEVQKKEHPETSPEMLTCQIDAAFEVQGLEGLSNIYKQTEPDNGTSKFNNNSYLRLTRSIPFENLVKEKCW